jgi:hypothetical protein
MSRPRSRGFVLGELIVAIAAFTTLTALAASVETEVDRLCVGAAPTSNAARPARIVTDVQRWMCVAVGSIEAPENRLARTTIAARTSP